MNSSIKVICLEDEAFYTLIEEVVQRISKGQETKEKWLSTPEAMALLGIKSKTTLQRLRDEGKIRFSQPFRKTIRYDRESLYAYLEKYTKETF